MPATRIGIVYAKRTGAIRRWIVPDNDSDLIDKHATSPGESMLVVDRTLIPSDPAKATPFVLAAIQRATGLVPRDPRCVVVDTDTGLVVAAIMADPILDSHPDGHIIEDATASAGWRLLTDGRLVDSAGADTAL